MSIQLAKKIKAIANAKTCKKNALVACDRCVLNLNKQLNVYIAKGEPIHFVLPAFPAKSANRNKTLSALPDLGELIALKRLQLLLSTITVEYSPGAKLTICSDGYVFNDVVGVHDQDVDDYKKNLIALSNQLGIVDINFFDLQDAHKANSLADLRGWLMDEYADDLITIKSNIQSCDNERQLFNGLHRFLYEDLRYLYPELSNNQLRKLAHQRTYQTIQRSHAWSSLVKATFPQAIRLSIHPYPCHCEKISFRLLPGMDQWATPWHNVVVRSCDQVTLMKQAEAVRLGARLVNKQQQLMSHYILE